MRRTRFPVVAAALVALALAGGACTARGGAASNSVVAAVYPLAFIAQEIAGSDLDVTTLTPAGGEPHDLELTPSQARSIAEADLVLYVGAGFQPAVEDAVEQTATGLDVLDVVAPLAAEGEEEHADEEPAEDEHGHEGADPHAWLDPTQATLIADSVLEQLIDVAPEHEDAFVERHAALSAELAELDASFSSGLADCEESTIVVSHEAFGYLTQRYGLQQMGIAGIDPEQEPSPQRLAEVTRFVTENQIETIYLERAVSREVGSTLADETGTEVAYLDPLEIEPEEGDLFTAMEANLEALRTGLGCSGSV